jgi:rhodanese-related sulfurtransferase
MIPDLSPRDLQSELGGPNPPKLLDVRESYELETAKLAEDLHIPISEFRSRMGEIDPKEDWVVICHSGGRSGQVTQYLLSQGFPRVRNLRGGLVAWAREVDPGMRGL